MAGAPDQNALASGHEKFGVLDLERLAKDDGRALLVFRRADGR